MSGCIPAHKMFNHDPDSGNGQRNQGIFDRWFCWHVKYFWFEQRKGKCDEEAKQQFTIHNDISQLPMNLIPDEQLN
jgi:hypothetical protein